MKHRVILFVSEKRDPTASAGTKTKKRPFVVLLVHVLHRRAESTGIKKGWMPQSKQSKNKVQFLHSDSFFTHLYTSPPPLLTRHPRTNDPCRPLETLVRLEDRISASPDADHRNLVDRERKVPHIQLRCLAKGAAERFC